MNDRKRHKLRPVFGWLLILLLGFIVACNDIQPLHQAGPPAVTITNPAEDSVVGSAVDVTIAVLSQNRLSALTLQVAGQDFPLPPRATSSYPLSRLTDGQHQITVVARDDQGLQTSRERRFLVDATPPRLELLFPRPDDLLADRVVFRAIARDPVVTGVASGVARVEFFARGSSVGLANDAGPDPDRPGYRRFELSVNAADATVLPPGQANIEVRATDGVGNVAHQSANVVIADPDLVPEVSFIAPATGARVQGTVNIEVNARSQQVGATIRQVEFFANGNLLGTGAAVGEVYSFSWNSAAAPDGAVTLLARATDAAGNRAEAQINVTTRNNPTVTWVSPTANQRVAGAVNLSVSVVAGRAITSVEFLLEADEGRSVIGTGTLTAGRYELRWSTLGVEPGQYTLIARVTDASGAVVEELLPIAVVSTFFISTPKEGDTVGPGHNRDIVAITVGINGTIPDGFTITQVRIFLNGQDTLQNATRQEATDGSQVFVYPWDTRNPLPGHDPLASGDRVIMAHITYTDDTRREWTTFTPGVPVRFSP